MDLKSKAISLFTKHTKYQKNNIIKIIPIHNGYTNISFKVITHDRKAYQVRISNTKNVDRINEKNILDLVKFPYFIYFDIHTGNAIKKWIDGTHPKNFKKLFLMKLVNKINEVHKIKVTKKVLKHDYKDCFKKTMFPLKHKNKYLELINKYKNLPLVLCHNDLNSDNLLLTKSKQIIFIDYEWGRLNNKYWDIANFIRESNLSLKMIKCILSFDKSLDRKVLCDFIYMCTNYAYQWTFNMKLTPKILKCRKINLVKMNKYYKLFFIANSR